MSDSEEGGVPLMEAEFDITLPDKKRKAEDELEVSAETKKANKKAKRKEKKKTKAKDINEDDLDQQLGVNHAFERMDSQLLADYINARTSLYGKDLSSVELEDKFIPSHCIKDSSTWGEARTLENLANYLKQQSKHLKPTSPDSAGAPHTLIITSSGIRAADTYRAINAGLPGKGAKKPIVLKLFAKHMKIAEQVEVLKKKCDFGVGTPDRLSALLDEKALSTSNLKRIVIDVSYIDGKKRGILDMKDLHEPLVKLLLRPEFVGEDKQKGTHLFLFY